MMAIGMPGGIALELPFRANFSPRIVSVAVLTNAVIA